MLAACSTPDLITEITLQPLRRYDVDAAIFFSDIVVPLRAVGVGIDIKPGVGPVVDEPIRDAADIRRLRGLDPGRRAVRDRGGHQPGRRAGQHAADRLRRRPVHAGLLPGRRRPVEELRDHQVADVRRSPRLWDAADDHADRHHDLLPARSRWRRARRRCSCSTPGSGRSAPRTTAGRCCRTASGCSRRWPRRGVPRIHFGVGTGELLRLMGEAGADVVGVDWRVPLDEAARRVEPGQGAAGQPGPGASCWPRGRSSSSGPGTSWTGAGRPRVTSSTWATGSCPAPTPACWPPGRLRARRVGERGAGHGRRPR